MSKLIAVTQSEWTARATRAREDRLRQRTMSVTSVLLTKTAGRVAAAR